MKQQKQKEPKSVRFKEVSDPSTSLVVNATQKKTPSNKDDKVTALNKKKYINNIIGQDKEVASEGCTSNSGSVESGAQISNNYLPAVAVKNCLTVMMNDCKLTQFILSILREEKQS